eukprot:10593206-Alexandrium_andersonii.AAC.1
MRAEASLKTSRHLRVAWSRAARAGRGRAAAPHTFLQAKRGAQERGTLSPHLLHSRFPLFSQAS